jgi:hypothetical protein
MTEYHIKPSPKLQAMIDQRIALIRENVPPSAANFIVTPLTEPPEGSSDRVMKRWERTCDLCWTYTPPGPDFFTGQAQIELYPGVHVLIGYGLCKSCLEKQI